MIIKQQLSRKQFQKANLNFLLNRLSIKIFIGIMSVFLILIIILKIKKQEFDISEIIVIPIAGTIGLPIVFHLLSGKRYDLNKALQEEVVFEFDSGTIKINAFEYSSEQTVSSFYQFSEIKNWFYLQHSHELYFPILMTELNEEQIQFLRGLI